MQSEKLFTFSAEKNDSKVGKFMANILSSINSPEDLKELDVNSLNKLSGEIREFLVEKFDKGVYKALVAIKCLDEGVNVPSADKVIIMSSSNNPREYVQRVGRVIRVDDNKKESVIYDIIVGSLDNSPTEIRILEKEARRALSIAKNAINFIEVISMFNKRGVDTSCLLVKK